MHAVSSGLIWERLGPTDEDYFLNGPDVDLYEFHCNGRITLKTLFYFLINYFKS